MGEGVAHDTGHRPPRPRHRRVAARFLRGPRVVPPLGARELHHAAEETLLGAAADEHGAVGAPRPKSHAQARRLGLGCRLARQLSGPPRAAGGASILPRTVAAGRVPGNAHGGAEVHQRLREIAGPGPGRQTGGQGGDTPGAAGQRFVHREKPRQHPQHVAVHRRRPAPEGDGGNGGGGVGADSRQAAQVLLVVGEPSAQVAGDDGGAAQQVARPGVVSEALPGVQHLVGGGGGQRRDVGPAGQEVVVVGDDRRHACLLEHDLAEPYAIGVGGGAGRRPPWQRAPVAVVPSQQAAAEGGGPGNVLLSRREHVPTIPSGRAAGNLWMGIR